MTTTRTNLSLAVLCVAALGLLSSLPSVAQVKLNEAVAAFLFDAGGDIAKDSSGTGNDGALWREPEWVDGRFGKALHFDGQSFVWIKEAKEVPLGTSPRTLMCHFKLDEAGKTGFLMALGPNAWSKLVMLSLFASGPAVQTFEDTVYFEWESDTDWHHLAAVFPENAKKTNEFLLYLDGVEQDTVDDDVNFVIDSGGGVMTIACSTAIGGFFVGTIDEVAVFPFALAEEDIANVAKRGLPKGGNLAVSPTGKLTTAWGTLKAR